MFRSRAPTSQITTAIKTLRSFRPVTLALFASIAFAAIPAAARDADGSTLWKVQGERNTVYLLGSIHVLSENDYPLSPALLSAYEDAEALVMEIDLDDLDPMMAATVVMSRARARDGETLRSILGSETWDTADEAAKAAGFRLDDFSASEPWYAAMILTQITMARMGYNAELGVDMYFSQLAQNDNKPIDGLETFEQQIDFFDSMPASVQADLLLQTLQDIAEYPDDMSGMIAAWKRGDIEYLESELLGALAKFPQLYETLVTRRNRAWVGKIEALLDDSIDYLVVVGALHLIGDDSVNRLLESRGYTPEKLP